MSVFVLGSDGNPLMPCSEKRARKLLEKKRAVVKRVYPFMIQLNDRCENDCELQFIELKIDPGSKTTGLCVSRTDKQVVNVLNLFELEHRGEIISRKMHYRAILRKNRRQRKNRYRKARYENRKRCKGWLPPSLRHRVEGIISWVSRIERWTPLTFIALECVKFDLQKMMNPDIKNSEYSKGTLFEKEVMEYLLEKWEHQCMYCGIKDAAFEKEHLIPKSRGGSNRITNLGLSCRKCNLAKGNSTLDEFLANNTPLLLKIKGQMKQPLRDAAVMNRTKNILFKALLDTGHPVEVGTGAQTKWNRQKFNIPKTHALDAACVGQINGIKNWSIPHIGVKSISRGRYSRTGLDRYGFPKRYFVREKRLFGFQSGDVVKVVGRDRPLTGTVAVRKKGIFKITAKKDMIETTWRNCKLVQRSDGYGYYRKQYSFYFDAKGPITVGQL